MGAPVPIITSIASGLLSANKQRKAEKKARAQREASIARENALQTEKLNKDRRNISRLSAQKRASLRANLGASGVHIKSNSNNALLKALKNNEQADLSDLNRNYQLRKKTNLLEGNGTTNNASNILGFLDSLKKIRF